MDPVTLFPLDGHEVLGAQGAICNFYVTFSSAGSWHLSFQQTDVVNRTYYQDQNQAPDYFWSDISNSTPGIPNTVTVVE